jgi:hypothetical protein
VFVGAAASPTGSAGACSVAPAQPAKAIPAMITIKKIEIKRADMVSPYFEYSDEISKQKRKAKLTFAPLP